MESIDSKAYNSFSLHQPMSEEEQESIRTYYLKNMWFRAQQLIISTTTNTNAICLWPIITEELSLSNAKHFTWVLHATVCGQCQILQKLSPLFASPMIHPPTESFLSEFGVGWIMNTQRWSSSLNPWILWICDLGCQEIL